MSENNFREIISQINKEQLHNLLKTLPKDKMVILKFYADWCNPCKKITNICKEYFMKLPENAIIIDVNIDDQIELYTFFKKKRRVNSIPAILMWYNDNIDNGDLWYISSDSVNTSMKREVIGFFERCVSISNKIKK
jgi:thioredoxin 1